MATFFTEVQLKESVCEPSQLGFLCSSLEVRPHCRNLLSGSPRATQGWVIGTPPECCDSLVLCGCCVLSVTQPCRITWRLATNLQSGSVKSGGSSWWNCFRLRDSDVVRLFRHLNWEQFMERFSLLSVRLDAERKLTFFHIF